MAFSLALANLFEASFRGIPFLINSAQTQRKTNKIIPFSPPNSNDTYAEGLGRKAPELTVNALLTGESFIINKEALKAALDDNSIGILVHPFEGIKNVQCLSYDVVEDYSSLGVVKFSINFIETVPAINPKITNDIISDILNAGNTVDTFLKNKVESVFNVSSYFVGNYIDSANKLNSISSQFSVFKNQIGQSSDSSSFDQANTNFVNNISLNISNPDQLAEALSNLFFEADAISTDPFLSGNAFISIFNFANIENFVPTVPTLSVQAIQRIKNRNILNYSFNSYALLYAYQNFCQATFIDTDQMNQIAQMLEAQYLKIMNGLVTQDELINVSTVLGFEVLESIEELRNLTRLQFNKDSNNTANLVNITVNNTLSASLISYYYYGNTNQAQSIIDLNDVQNPSFAKGVLKSRTVQ